MSASDHFFRGLRLPLAVRGCTGRPGGLLSEADLKALANNNEQGANGLFPIGLYQTWHSGIHLWAAAGATVHSLCDGTIVAACLGERSRERNVFGSRGFVLVRHTITCAEPEQTKAWQKPKKLENLTFFALYQHLEGLSGSQELAPWLLHLRPYILKGRPPEGTYVKLNGAPVVRKGNKRFVAELRTEPTKVKHKAGDAWVAGKHVLHRAPGGSVAHVLDEEKGEFRLVRILGNDKVGPTEGWISYSAATVQEIPDMAGQIQRLIEGGVAALDIPVFAGETLGWVGKIAPEHSELRPGAAAATGLHLEIFGSDALVTKSNAVFTVLTDDTDKDVMAELGPGLGKLADPELKTLLRNLAFDTAEGELATSPEKRSQYLATVPANTKAKLRQLATRNTSYWAIDWESVDGQSAAWSKRYKLTETEKADANRYSWWRQLLPKAKELGLPPDALAYHVHPIGFLKHILGRQLKHPVFYAEFDGQVRVVHGVEPSEAPWKGGIDVWVHDPGVEGAEDWCLSTVLRYKKKLGLGSNDPPNLYEILIENEGPQVPGLGADAKRIWASLWNVEGGLEAVNTYDNQFITFGPFQHAGGTGGNAGELAGVLSVVKRGHPELFQKLFVDRGLDVQKASGGELVTGYFIFDDEKLTTASKKERLRTFYPAYLLRMAMDDEAFAGAFLKQGFERLKIIRKWAGLTETFASELGQALVLDAHINRPTVARNWEDAVKPARPENKIVGALESDERRALVNRFIYQRLSSGLNDPFRRTALILACTLDVDDAYKAELKEAIERWEDFEIQRLDEAIEKAKSARDEAKANGPGETVASKKKHAKTYRTLCKQLTNLESKRPAVRMRSEKHPLWPALEEALVEASAGLKGRGWKPFLRRD